MSDTTIAVLLGLATALGWGFADFWAARASKAIGAMSTLIVTCWLIVIAFVPIYPFLPKSTTAISMSGVVLAGLAGAFVTLAAAFFYKGLAAGPVSIVSPITGAYPLATTLLALVVFGVKLSGLQVVAIVAIVLGVMAASGLFTAKKNERRLGRGPMLGMLASILYGIGFGCLGQAAQRIGWQHSVLIEFITFGIVAVPLLPLLEPGKTMGGQIVRACKNPFVIGNALLATLTIIAFNIGLTYEHTSGTIVTAVSACYPALTVALALRHFKEEVRLIPLLGAGATISGIVLLAIG